MSHTELDKLSADERRALLADLLRSKQRSGPADTGSLIPDRDARYEPFPLTDVQYAYWLGQQGLYSLGNVSTHAYFEVEAENVNVERIERALNRLIGYHDMLRAVVGNDGRQRILKSVEPYRIRTQDLRGAGDDAEQRGLLATRGDMSHQVLPYDRWPLFDVRATLFGVNRTRLHVSFSLLIVDAWSIRILLMQWFALYDNLDLPLPALELSFRDYVLAEEAARADAEYKRAEAYWRDRLESLQPAPDLPLAKDPGEVTQPRFVRFSRTLDEKHRNRLASAARRANLTPSGLLLTAFGIVLRRWSQRSEFSINATVFNRRTIHPQVFELVGDFTSTMLVAFNGAADATFLQSARRLQRQYLEDLDHSRYSGIRVLRDLARLDGRSISSYTPVVFTSISGTAEPTAQLLSASNFVYGISQTPQVWLDHQVMEQGHTLVLTWDAVEELFPEGLLGEMFEAYGDLLHRLAYDPTVWEEKTVVGLPQAQRRIRDAVNDTAKPLTNDCLHLLFARSAAAGRDRVAVVADGKRRTYGQILGSAQPLARKLREMGARSGHPVAVALNKGYEQVVAVLGILESGAAYLPVDPTWPAPRLRQVLEIGEIETVVTTPALAADLSWPAGVRCLTVDGRASGDTAESHGPANPEDLAYVIFTSGSTGTPKGVMTDHRGAVNTILDINERFAIGPDDRVLALSALHFDLSVYDIFGLLAAGGAVVIPGPGENRDPRRWSELIREEGITVWNTVPALMEMLVEYLEGRGTTLDSLRLVMLSGDWIPVSLPDRIRRIAPSARIISLGGATEASIWSIYYPIEKVDPRWTSIPYGKALRNQKWHVLSSDLEDCPTWVPGDLYISGVGLAKGYWRDEKKTSECFITHPATGERLYRTGDRGRYLPDGNIEFLGRIDSQVKIRGHRIELGEIECALSSHPQVQRAVVAAVGKDRSNKHLVGYAVLRKDGNAEHSTAPCTHEQLREHVAARLPCHMVPSEVIILDELPLTPNGKVNRDLLPHPSAVETPGPSSAEAGADPRIARMAELIARELGLDSIAPDANLMNLGADSVDMVRIANRIEAEFGFQPSLAEFFRNPTIIALVAAQGRSASPRADRTPSLGGFAASETKLQGARVILDPNEREAFKARMPGVRQFDPNHSRVPLEPPATESAVPGIVVIRRSQRSFAPTPLPVAALGHLLENLRRWPMNGSSKYAYGSAGGLYPVQAYIHIKHGRVAGLDCGAYYYHPAEHALVALASGAEIDPDAHEPLINRGIFEQAAFSIFLITQLNAIEPLYGEHALRFSMIEAGLMTQLLEMEAPRHGIGLCQIGWMDFDRIRSHFLLDNGHRLVHCLLGGPLPEPATRGGEDVEGTPAATGLRDRELGEI
jgi:amino acid adenylation domain-containing protein